MPADTTLRPPRRIGVALLDPRSDALAVLHSLRHTGRYDVTALDVRGRSVLRFSSRSRYIPVTGWNWEAPAGQLEPVARRLPETILFPVSMDAVLWVGRHRRSLANSWLLPALPDVWRLETARDKELTARFAERIAMRVPAFANAAVPGDIARLRFPVLLKPRLGSGGLGIEKYDAGAALDRRLRGLAHPEDYIVQNCVEGRDISCGFFSTGGRTTVTSPYIGLSRLGKFGPFRSTARIEDAEVSAAVTRLAAALQWEGIANVDLRRDEKGRLFLLEINPRPWANMMTSPPGINFADLWCRSAGLGAPMEDVPSHGSPAGASGITIQHCPLSFVRRDPLPHLLVALYRLSGICARARETGFAGLPRA